MLPIEPVTLIANVGPMKFICVTLPNTVPSSLTIIPLPDNTNELTWFCTDATLPDSEAESILYELSSTKESIMSVLNSLSNVGVIAPTLLFGKLLWFSAANCVLFN